MIYAGVQGMIVHICSRFLRGSCGLKFCHACTPFIVIYRRFLRGSCGLKFLLQRHPPLPQESLSTRKLWIEIANQYANGGEHMVAFYEEAVD